MNNIKLNDTSPEVNDLQIKLKGLGYGIKPDSNFGPKTLTALHSFQKLNGLPETDFVDENAYNLIVSDLNNNSLVDKPSFPKIMSLHPKIRFEVLHLFKELLKKGLKIRIVQGFRTFAEQDELYAQGRTKPGSIVTNARGGFSNHNYGLSCYDDKTEILTDSGFKLFKDLMPEDLVATFKDDICTFEKPLRYINYYYNGEMIRIKTRSVDQLITPNHKMVVKKKTNTKWDEDWKFITAENLNHQYKIPTNGKFWEYNSNLEEVFEVQNKSTHSKYSIIDNNIKNKNKISYPFQNYMDAESWWGFMGWYLSEGYSTGSSDGQMRQHNGRYKVSICQTKKSDVRHKLENCLKSTGFVYGENNSEFYIHSKELHSVLLGLGNSYQKYIPRYLLEAPKELLEKLYYSLIDGDGCYYKGHEVYYTSSKKMCHSFVELSLRLGFSVSINERFKKAGTQMLPHGEYNKKDILNYEVVTRKGITQELRNGNSKKTINKEHYEGFVYCVTTNSGAVFIKRNNKISVGGNCDFCLLKPDGSISWSLSEDANHDGNADWMQVVDLFKSYGYDWGGNWKFKDNPHLEKTFGLSIRQLLNLYNAFHLDDDGYVTI